jgi:protein SCO1
MNRSRLILLAVAAAVVLGAALVTLRIMDGAPRSASTATSTGAALVGGPFKLVDQDGKAVDESILEGKWTAVFFGYTYCPDVCPLTLQVLGQAQQQMGPRGRDLQTLFITVDPARDTPAQLKTYLSSPVFPRGTIGLTGTAEQVDAAAKAYRAPYSREGEGEGYLMNHPAMLYLMDPQGRFNRIIAHGLTPEDTARQIATAMREGAAL